MIKNKFLIMEINYEVYYSLQITYVNLHIIYLERFSPMGKMEGAMEERIAPLICNWNKKKNMTEMVDILRALGLFPCEHVDVIDYFKGREVVFNDCSRSKQDLGEYHVKMNSIDTKVACS